MAKYQYKYVVQFEENGCTKYFDLIGAVYSIDCAEKYDSLEKAKYQIKLRGRNEFYKNFKIYKLRVYYYEVVKTIDVEVEDLLKGE